MITFIRSLVTMQCQSNLIGIIENINSKQMAVENRQLGKTWEYKCSNGAGTYSIRLRLNTIHNFGSKNNNNDVLCEDFIFWEPYKFIINTLEWSRRHAITMDSYKSNRRMTSWAAFIRKAYFNKSHSKFFWQGLFGC